MDKELREKLWMKDENGEEYRLLTVPEVAKFMGVSRYHVYNLASEGRMPVIRIGRSLRFDLKKVLRVLAEDTRGEVKGTEHSEDSDGSH